MLNNNIIYKIIAGKNENDIFIKCKKYKISFNQIELSALINIKINSLDEELNFVNEIFEDNKVKLAKKWRNKINNRNKLWKNIELTLIYDNKYINEN